MSIQPFKIDVPQATLDDLHERLAHTGIVKLIADGLIFSLKVGNRQLFSGSFWNISLGEDAFGIFGGESPSRKE
jgi:hypothetical protein